MRKLYARAKKNILGFLNPKRLPESVISPNISLLQEEIRQATASAFNEERTDQSIVRLQNLENLMTKEYCTVRNRQFYEWL